MADTSKLEAELDKAIDEFNFYMNSKNNEYTKAGYNEDAILMMDALAKQTSELACKFKDAIIDFCK